MALTSLQGPSRPRPTSHLASQGASQEKARVTFPPCNMFSLESQSVSLSAFIHRQDKVLHQTSAGGGLVIIMTVTIAGTRQARRHVCICPRPRYTISRDASVQLYEAWYQCEIQWSERLRHKEGR